MISDEFGQAENDRTMILFDENGEATTEEFKSYAKKVVFSKHGVFISSSSHLLVYQNTIVDPFKISVLTRKVLKFVRVDDSVFDLYCRYLKTKFTKHLNAARRCHEEI